MRINSTGLCILIICFLLPGAASIAQNKASRYPIIPYPSELIAAKGFFTITSATTIKLEDALFKNEAAFLSELFSNSFGRHLSVTIASSKSSIILKKDETIKSPEAYRIVISIQAITLSANSPAGMFRAIQTIRQLLPASIEVANKSLQPNLSLPCVQINDAPSFQWRGLHLDVSRHFFSLDYVKKLIGLMSLYKFNKFHLHLTDDQGWRIEIKKYPKLTEEGAWRTFNNQDSVCMQRAKENPDFIIDPKHIIQKNGKTLYGGFYTQAQLKELVSYAAARHIDIVPEIDMPGHMMAAINSYTYLSCDSTSFFGALFSKPICPCNPVAVQFAKDIYTEVMDIFPSEYIHIGGDEVDRSWWEKSDACKNMMKEKGFKESAELQSWFIKEMEKFFNAHGRKLIGWDEILEGGVSKTAAIMNWRTWVPNAPVEAAKNGNKVIMTPGAPLYFNEQPDKNSLPAVYNYDLIPKNLSATEAKNIIGAQGNLWTEFIPTEQRADYLYMPRMMALAEVTWSSNKNYEGYLQRLKVHYKRLDVLNVAYRLPDLPLLHNYAFTDNIRFNISKPLDDIMLRYTVDGSLPTARSSLMPQNVFINQSQHLRVSAFKNDRRGDVYDLKFNKQPFAKAETISSLKDGLTAAWYKKAFDSTTVISGNHDGIFEIKNIIVPKQAEAASFTMQYSGYINVPQDGVYTFYLTSDDASVLKIAGREVVNNDGMHAPKERNGQVALHKGLHSFKLDFIEGGGGYTLKLQYSKGEEKSKDIPHSWFKH
jgi:hexosaminidase